MEMWDVSDVYVTSVTEFVIVMRIFIYLKKKKNINAENKEYFLVTRFVSYQLFLQAYYIEPVILKATNATHDFLYFSSS